MEVYEIGWIKVVIINKKNLMCAVLWCGITSVEYFYLTQAKDYNLILQEVACLSIINLFTQLGIWKLTKQSLMAPFMVFIYCAYIFHFGQIVMTGLFSNVAFSYLNYIEVYMTNHVISIKTMKIIVICLNMIFLGGIIGVGINQSSAILQDKLNNERKDKNLLLQVAKILLIISSPFRLFIDIQTLIAAVIGGYYGAIAVQYSGIIDCIAGFWYSAVILYYLGLNDLRKKRAFIIIIVFYMVIVMLTGNRGHQIVCLLMLFVVFVLENRKKFSIKNFLGGIILIYVGLIFIDVIYSMREFGIDYFFNNFTKIVGESLKANIFFETIGSFGETIFTPYLVVQGIDKGTINPGFGECFYKSILSVFPTIGTTMRRISIEANFTKMLNSWSAIGGSIVGEMYYNFRNMYWIFSCIVGIILGNLSFKITNGLENKRYTILLYAIPIFTNLVWWCRDSIGNAVRNIVWICCTIWIIKKMLVNKN